MATRWRRKVSCRSAHSRPGGAGCGQRVRPAGSRGSWPLLRTAWSASTGRRRVFGGERGEVPRERAALVLAPRERRHLLADLRQPPDELVEVARAAAAQPLRDRPGGLGPVARRAVTLEDLGSPAGSAAGSRGRRARRPRGGRGGSARARFSASVPAKGGMRRPSQVATRTPGSDQEAGRPSAVTGRADRVEDGGDRGRALALHQPPDAKVAALGVADRALDPEDLAARPRPRARPARRPASARRRGRPGGRRPAPPPRARSRGPRASRARRARTGPRPAPPPAPAPARRSRTCGGRSPTACAAPRGPTRCRPSRRGRAP